MEGADDVQAERRAWAEFERRDGWLSGFVIGIMAGATLSALTFLVVSWLI